MSVRLMDRLSLAMQYGAATPQEQQRIVAAMTPRVQEFGQLPDDIQKLVADLEARAVARLGPMPSAARESGAIG